jgi:hypothetical protein
MRYGKQRPLNVLSSTYHKVDAAYHNACIAPLLLLILRVAAPPIVVEVITSHASISIFDNASSQNIFPPVITWVYTPVRNRAETRHSGAVSGAGVH